MWVCYLIAAIPLVVGAVLWLFTRRVTFSEWIWGSVVGFVVCGIFHYVTILRLTSDYEIRSGRVVFATHHPEWEGEPQMEGDSRVHTEHWTATVSFGTHERAFYLTEEEFAEIREKFGAAELRTIRPEKPGFEEGDPNDYVADNHTDAVVPAHVIRILGDRVQIDRSLFSFSEAAETAALFEYPLGAESGTVETLPLARAIYDLLPDETDREIPVLDWRRSRRLLGRAAEDFDLYAWDSLNAVVGPARDVNLIAIGFEGDSLLGHQQEAKWQGGKRNDLVICYGPAGESGQPAWTYCFGWSEDPLVKSNLETLFLTHVPGNDLLPRIEEEVTANYRQKRWREFSYLTLEPPRGALATLIVIMLIVQGRYWFMALRNHERRAAVGAGEVREAEEERRKHALSAWRRRRGRVKGKLSDLEDPEDIEAMARDIRSAGEDRRCFEVVHLLGRSKNPRAIPLLVLGLTNRLYGLWDDAARYLDQRGVVPGESPEAREAVPHLLTALTDRDGFVRAAARRVLDLVDPDWAVAEAAVKNTEYLLSQLQRDSRKIQEEALVDALGARGARVTDALIELVDARRPQSMPGALRALGRTGDLRAVATLRTHLEGEIAALRKAAAEGFAFFGPNLACSPDAGALFEVFAANLAEARDRGMKFTSLCALGWLGNEAAVDLLVPFLEERDWGLRSWAITSLGRLSSPRAIEPLVRRMQAGKSQERVHIVRALAAIDDPRIVPPLLEQFDHVLDPNVRHLGGTLLPITIMEVVWKFGGDEVKARLKRGLDEPMVGIETEAAQCLDYLEGRSAPSPWLPALV